MDNTKVDYSTKSIEELYQIAGQRLVDCVSWDWDRLEADAMYSTDTSLIKLNSYKDGERKSFEDELDVVPDVLEEVQKRINKDPEKPWNRFLFTVTSDGKFNLDIRYIAANETEWVRENEDWEKKESEFWKK